MEVMKYGENSIKIILGGIKWYNSKSLKIVKRTDRQNSTFSFLSCPSFPFSSFIQETSASF